MARLRIRWYLLFRLAVLATLLCAAGAPRNAAADVVIGTPGGPDNVFPFGTNTYVGEYQQLYTKTAFSGPVSIIGVGFASSALGGQAGLSRTLNVTLGLSTSSATLTTMSTNYAANKGADFTQVFNGVVNYTAAGNGTFDLNFTTTPFTYNPGGGNLLLDVVMNSSSGSQIAFVSTIDPVTTRVYNSGGSGAATVDPNHGLVTIVRTSALAVPEPGSFALASLVAFAASFGAALRRARLRTRR
jgi:hypothetical protein